MLCPLCMFGMSIGRRQSLLLTNSSAKRMRNCVCVCLIECITSVDYRSAHFVWVRRLLYAMHTSNLKEFDASQTSECRWWYSDNDCILFQSTYFQLAHHTIRECVSNMFIIQNLSYLNWSHTHKRTHQMERKPFAWNDWQTHSRRREKNKQFTKECTMKYGKTAHPKTDWEPSIMIE